MHCIVLNYFKNIYFVDFLMVKLCRKEVAMPIHYIILQEKFKMSC